MYKIPETGIEGFNFQYWRDVTMSNIGKKYVETMNEYKSLLDTIQHIINVDGVDPATLVGTFERMYQIYK